MNANELKELYLKLEEKEISLDLLEEADSFRQEAKKAGNDEYYLRGTLLIIDIFTQGDDNLLDDALRLGLDIYNLARSYSEKYPDIYKRYLYLLSYIYITKQLYQQALPIETERKNYIDPSDKDEVNRWQLELAYIYNALDEKNEALRKFQAILVNDPDNETKSVCLSNLSQLYIEERDFDNAKKTLEENYRFAKEINDEQGIRYINCLKGIIYRLQKEYKNSYNTLYPLIKDIEELNIENFNYLNEFITLLIDMGRFNEGLELINKYFNEVAYSFDLADKLVFYKNALKLEIEENGKKKRNSLFDAISLLDKINEIEKEIQKNKEVKTSKIRESELDLDAFNKERTISSRIKENLLKVNTSNYDSLRDFLLSFASSLNDVIPMDEVLVVLFDKTLNQDLTIIPLKEELISTYEYKNNRLYERKLTYNELDKTVILDIINSNTSISLDFTKSNYAYINPVSKDFYVNEKVKYLIGYPLVNRDMVFGEVIYLSKSNNILDYYNNDILEIITSLFRSSLKNMLYIENNNLEHSLYETITKEQGFGVFYYSDANKTYILSDGLKDLIKVSKTELSVDSFNDLIIKSDLSKYSKKYNDISANKDYNITYHLIIDGVETLVREKGVATLINNNLYYVGTIMKIDLERSTLKELNNEVLDINNLNEELERRRKDKFSCLAISNSFDYDYYQKLRRQFKEDVYFDRGIYYVLFNEKLKELNMIMKLNKELLKGKYTIIEYPSPLVRLDDLVGVSEYVLRTATTPYTVFTNEIYASFISINTIDTMVNRAIIEDKITLLTQNVTLNSQFVGYVYTPNIPGVYDLVNLKVVSLDTISLLDKYMVKKLEKEDNISIYSLRLESLKEILENNLSKSAKLVFNISGYNDPKLINDCIAALIDTKSRLIIDYELFKNISLDNINNHSDIILALSNDLDSEKKEFARKYINDFYIYDDADSLKVSKIINKK